MEKVSTATEGLCDVCRRRLPHDRSGCRHGELLANWGEGSAHVGEQYRLQLCESCFFYALATLRSLRRTASMFDDEVLPDALSFGRVHPGQATDDDVRQIIMRAEFAARLISLGRTRAMPALLERACEHWLCVEPLLRAPASEEAYLTAVGMLYQLLDIVGDNEQHPLQGLLALISDKIAAYDAEHFPVSSCSPAQVLQYLMTERGLGLDDLPEVANSAGIADLLGGRKRFTRKQIRALSGRFGVPSTVFR